MNSAFKLKKAITTTNNQCLPGNPFQSAYQTYIQNQSKNANDEMKQSIQEQDKEFDMFSHSIFSHKITSLDLSKFTEDLAKGFDMALKEGSNGDGGMDLSSIFTFKTPPKKGDLNEWNLKHANIFCINSSQASQAMAQQQQFITNSPTYKHIIQPKPNKKDSQPQQGVISKQKAQQANKGSYLLQNLTKIINNYEENNKSKIAKQKQKINAFYNQNFYKGASGQPELQLAIGWNMVSASDWNLYNEAVKLNHCGRED